MARPIKKGLDYFPVDVGIMADKKFRKAKMRYGYLAFCVYFALLCLIYEDEGYYIDYSEEHQDDVVWGIMDYLQGKYQPTAEAIAEVIECLVECELFSGYHFDAKILTSKRIQASYYMATVERKTIDVNFDFWLLSEEEMRAMSKSSVILRNFVNQSNNSVNRANNSVNRSNNPQIEIEREIESKVEIKTPKPQGKTYLYGCFQNVPLTQEEIVCLEQNVEGYSDYIDRVSTYMSNRGKTYDNCCETIIKWAKQDGRYVDLHTKQRQVRPVPFL